MRRASAEDPAAAEAKQPDRSEERRDSLGRIFRRWRRARRHLLQTNWWTEPPLLVCGRLGVLAGATSSVLLTAFTQAIVPLPATANLPAVVTLLPFRLDILAALALLWLVNAWLIDRHLAQRTAREASVRPWLRVLRFCIAGIPLLGHYAIPGWRWILNREPEPAWAFRPAATPRLPPSIRARFSGVATERVGSAAQRRRHLDDAGRRLTGDLSIGLLLLGNAVALGVAVFSATAEHPEPGQRLVVATLGGILHLLAFAAAAIFFFVEARRAETSRFGLWLYTSPALLWLLPIPYLALGGILVIWVQWLLADRSPQEGTLVHNAYTGREALYLPQGRTLEETVRRQWKGASRRERLRQPGATLPPPAEPTYAQDRLFWLYRIKSIVLAFDAMAVGWTALWIADRQPGWRAPAEQALDLIINASGVLCLLALLVMAVYFVALALRSAGPLAILDRHPYAQYAAITQFSWLAGLEVGRDLFEQEAEALARTLQAVGILGCLATFVAFVLRILLPGGERIRQPFHGLLGLVGFLAVGMAGQSGASDEAYAQGLMSWVTALALTVPLWHVLIGRFFLDWLLRPHEASDLRRGKLANGVRRTLQFLTATLVLPLGGLAIPLWIYVRHRK